MATPKYIINKAKALNKALVQVARLAEELEDWVEKQDTDIDAYDFFLDNHLDNPYEFNLAELLESLDEVANN